MAGNIKVIEPRDNFQKVSKDIIFNGQVDVLTLGIYVKILCLGKKWELNVKGLAETLGVSTEKIRRAFATLEDTGYLRRTRSQDGNGRFVGWDYEISAEPLFINTDMGETRRSENPDVGKTRNSENTDVLNRDNKENKDNTSKQRLYTHSAPDKFDFRKSLIELGVTPDTADQWMLVRKRKGAVNTKAAFDTIAKEIAKAAPTTAEACIYRAVAESWRGFKAEWLHDKAPQAGSTTPQPPSNMDTRPRPRHDKHLDVDFSQFYPD